MSSDRINEMVEEREQRMVVEDELAPEGVERRMGRDERSDRLARVVIVAASRADQIRPEGHPTGKQAEYPGMSPELLGWTGSSRGWAGRGHQHQAFLSVKQWPNLANSLRRPVTSNRGRAEKARLAKERSMRDARIGRSQGQQRRALCSRAAANRLRTPTPSGATADRYSPNAPFGSPRSS